MRRALAMLGCGISPSPPISLDVSTMITRRRHSSAKMRAQSRKEVPAVTQPLTSKPLASAVQCSFTRDKSVNAFMYTGRVLLHMLMAFTLSDAWPPCRPRKTRSARQRL